MKIFVTGTAGFIGFHLARRLLAEGHEVVGYDGLTDYYDVRLKHARHAMLAVSANFRPVIGRLENADLLQTTVRDFAPEIVLHFAAQAGVRYSIEHPETYVASNLDGTFNLLEALRASPPRHALLASTSSVYGANPGPAFRETERTDFPVSIYAATKRGTESLAHSYAHLFGIPTTMLRFFTVYGPWGRPDMAPLKFATAITRGTPLDIYGGGNMSRDFTYIDDVVEAVTRLIPVVPVQGHTASPAELAVAGRALARRQHRRRRSGAAAGVHRRLRVCARQAGAPQSAADAARRCRRHPRRHHFAARLDRLCPADVRRRRRQCLRRVVPHSDVIAPAVLRIVVEHPLRFLDRQQRAGRGHPLVRLDARKHLRHQ